MSSKYEKFARVAASTLSAGSLAVFASRAEAQPDAVGQSSTPDLIEKGYEQVATHEVAELAERSPQAFIDSFDKRLAGEMQLMRSSPYFSSIRHKQLSKAFHTDKYHSTINGIGSEDFPVMPAIKGGSTWKIPAGELKRGLQKVVLAASNDDSRPVLTGVYFNDLAGEAIVAATDSYRLAEHKLGKHKGKLNFLVPASAASDLLRIIGDSGDEVTITHDDQQVMFQVSDITLVARLIEGNYPDYRKLIPTKFATVAHLARADFINITKVSSLFARESAGSITINAADKKVSINAIASQLGENMAEADAEVKGSGEVTLNSRYLIEALNAFSGEQIDFCFNGKLEPCILRSSDDSSYVHLVMPLRS